MPLLCLSILIRMLRPVAHTVPAETVSYTMRDFQTLKVYINSYIAFPTPISFERCSTTLRYAALGKFLLFAHKTDVRVA